MLNPADFGGSVLPESIFGGDTVEEASKLFTQILSGNGTDEQNRVVVANTALALQTYGAAESLDECIGLANESLVSGKAMSVLKKLISLN